MHKFSKSCRALEITQSGNGRVAKNLLVKYYSTVDLLTADEDMFYQAQSEKLHGHLIQVVHPHMDPVVFA